MKAAAAMATGVEARSAPEGIATDGSPAGPLAGTRVDTVNTLAAMTALHREWRELERACARPANLFQSFDWCHAWARTYADGQAGCRLHVVTVRRNGRLLLVWPLMNVCVGPFCVLRWLSDPFGQYGDILVDPSAGPAVVEAAWNEIVTSRAADTLRLRHVRADAAIFAFLERHARQCGQPDQAPALDLTHYPTEAAYEARYTKVQRRRRKRIRKDLEAGGPLAFEVIGSGEALTGAIRQAVDLKRRWLDDRGLHSRALACPRLPEFLGRLSQADRSPRVLTSMLSVAGQPVSFEIGLRHRGHHFGYITAHQPALTDASPARLHMDFSQRRAIADGMSRFDLMIPADPHKASWANTTVDVCDFFKPLNLRGALYGHTYLALVRPLARRGYYGAPPALRRLARRMLGR